MVHANARLQTTYRPPNFSPPSSQNHGSMFRRRMNQEIPASTHLSVHLRQTSLTVLMAKQHLGRRYDYWMVPLFLQLTQSGQGQVDTAKFLNTKYYSRNIPFCTALYQARISSRRGPTWRGPKTPPMKNSKTENSSNLSHYFLGPGKFIFLISYFYYKILFYFSAQWGEAWATCPPPPPLATSLFCI